MLGISLPIESTCDRANAGWAEIEGPGLRTHRCPVAELTEPIGPGDLAASACAAFGRAWSVASRPSTPRSTAVGIVRIKGERPTRGEVASAFQARAQPGE